MIVEATIETAILALAAMDTDHARKQNGVGFNGRDTAFGNSLAFQVKAGRTLTPRQRAAAYRMLRTYRVQLQSYGIDYGAIPSPEDTEPEAKATGVAVRYQDDVLVVHFDGFPGELLPWVKDVPGRRYVPASKDWLVPVTSDTLPYIEAWPKAFQIPEPVRALMAEMERDKAIAEVASKATDAELDMPIARDLFPFQRAGVAYAVTHGRVIIADEMGLGKTVQALASIEHENAYPALVVVPAVVKLNWARETERWLPMRDVEVLHGTKPHPLGRADVVIVNYDILARWKDTLDKVAWRSIVFDESHYLKSKDAARTKVSKALAFKVPMRLMLTGTPILNRPIELASQLEILGRLDGLGGFWAYAKRYCNAYRAPYGWDMTGSANLAELNRKLRQTCLVRRTKDEVLSELPAKRRAMVPIELEDRQAYEEVKRKLAVWLKERLLADQAWMAKVRDAGEDAEQAAHVAAWHKEQAMGRAKTLVMIEALRDTAARQKLPGALRWLDEFTAGGQKIVVFAHHRDIARGIRDHFGERAVMLTGETSPEDRQRVVDRFQTDPTCQVFVGNMQAAGVGITLTAASDVAFVELPWRPGDLMQAEDRCHRIGQTDSVTAWYLLAAGTIEEKIAAMLDTKRQVVDEATDGKVGLAEGESIVEGLMEALESEV